MPSCTHNDHVGAHHEAEMLCETGNQIHQSWASARSTSQHQTLRPEMGETQKEPQSSFFQINYTCTLTVGARESVGLIHFTRI